MRRWGLYVSRPLGPEESVNLFTGGRAAAGPGRPRVAGWVASAARCRGGLAGACCAPCGLLAQPAGCLPHPTVALARPATRCAEPALFLVNPAGLLHVVVYSNASFARPDLKQIVQGGRPARGRAGRGAVLAWGGALCWLCLPLVPAGQPPAEIQLSGFRRRQASR